MPQYKPITITLETPEEAAWFYHTVNRFTSTDLSTYLEDYTMTIGAYNNLRHRVYTTYLKEFNKQNIDMRK